MDHRPADSAEANEGEPGSEGEPPVRFRDLLKILRPHHRTIAVAMVLSLFSAGLGVLQPLLAMRAIERAGAPDLYHVLLLLGAVFVADAVIQTLSQYLLERVGEGLVLGLRKRLIANLLRLKIFVFERNRIGDLLARVGTDPTLLRQGVAYGFVDVWAGFFTLVASVALMVWIDWALFILTAATVAAAGALVTFALLGIREATERAQDRVGAMTADLERALGAIRTVRSAQGEERETERIVGHAQAAYRQGLRIARMESLVNPSIELAANGAFILVLVVGGIRVANESISLAELVAFLLYVSYLVVPVAVLFGSFAAVQKGMGALQRIQDAMDFSIEGEEKSDPSLASRSFEVVTQAQCAEQRPSTNDCTGNVALELENISFTYEDRDDPALRGVSFKVPRRAHWALVGPSGAGKSTLFALIERFYDPDEGVIRLAGRDLSHMSRAECRAQVALVEQHAPVLHGTLHDNLVYARPEASSAEIERVIELAGLHEVVTRLPNGLDADVGERGESLSGGERQRLAIGRALLARPMLLLMDEPTAQLDTINEAALAASMEKIAADCTVLVIAHRLSTVRSADSIVVLDQGRVVGIGKHDQLVEGCLTYRTLADSKMLGGAARLAH